MSKTPVDKALGEIRGQMDGFVYRLVEGETVIGRHPRPTEKPPTDEQLVAREQFRRSAGFARYVFETPELKEQYRLRAERQGFPVSRLWAFVVRDHQRPPEIKEIVTSQYKRQIGDPILVYAVDDTEVTSVTVSLQRQDGTVIEAGPATDLRSHWEYRATVAAPAGEPLVVQVTATDPAGNAPWEKLGINT